MTSPLALRQRPNRGRQTPIAFVRLARERASASPGARFLCVSIETELSM
jgi:hypothetical protein